MGFVRSWDSFLDRETGTSVPNNERRVERASWRPPAELSATLSPSSTRVQILTRHQQSWRSSYAHASVRVDPVRLDLGRANGFEAGGMREVQLHLERGVAVPHSALFDRSAVAVVRYQIGIALVLVDAGVEHGALLA